MSRRQQKYEKLPLKLNDNVFFKRQRPAKAATYFSFCIDPDRLVPDFGQFPGNVCQLFQILMKSLNDTHIYDKGGT